MRKNVKLNFQRKSNPKFQELLLEDERVVELSYPTDIFVVVKRTKLIDAKTTYERVCNAK